MSDNNEPTASSTAPEKEAPPLTNQHIFVITELAKVGLSYLKAIVNDPSFKIDDPDPAKAAAQENHLKGLANIAGPETVAHFDKMSQYIFEQEQAAKNSGKGSNDAV